jgi:hypothetical protein
MTESRGFTTGQGKKTLVIVFVGRVSFSSLCTKRALQMVQHAMYDGGLLLPEKLLQKILLLFYRF